MYNLLKKHLSEYYYIEESPIDIETDIIVGKSNWTRIRIDISHSGDSGIIKYQPILPPKHLQLLSFLGLHIPILVLVFTSWRKAQNDIKKAFENTLELMQ